MSRRSPVLVLLGLATVLVAAALMSIGSGPGGLQPGADVMKLRLLRILLGIAAGGTLALTGAALQGLLRNPLVDPFTLGVASGAAFGSSIAVLLGAFSALLMPVFGLGGALATIIIVYSLARIRGRVTLSSLVLAGVIVSFLFSSLVMLVIVLSRKPLGQAVYLMMGHLGVTFTAQSLGVFWVVLAVVVGGSILLLSRSRELDIVAASEAVAPSLGVNTGGLTRMVFLTSSVMVGAVVAFTGAVSFVGLVVPHLVRLLLGPRHRLVLPASFLGGGALLLVADVVARSIVPGGLPLSVVTALIGVPFFIYLLRTRL